MSTTATLNIPTNTSTSNTNITIPTITAVSGENIKYVL